MIRYTRAERYSKYPFGGFDLFQAVRSNRLPEIKAFGIETNLIQSKENILVIHFISSMVDEKNFERKVLHNFEINC